jgi:hypothetical protein
MKPRGRAKKTAIATAEPITNLGDEAPLSSIIAPVVQKKVSKKKQFPIVAVVTPDGIEGNLLPEARKPLIVHLPIQPKNVDFCDDSLICAPLRMPPCAVEPYNSIFDDPYSDNLMAIDDNNFNINSANNVDKANGNLSENNKKQENNAYHNGEEKEAVDYFSLKSTLLVEYKNSSETKQIPTKTDSACMWCCHTFETHPVILPIRDQGEYLQVCGNFCCPECAAAYLFDIKQDSHTRWEQFALLNRIYGEACNGKIFPSPSRSTLKMFGGSFTIEEYRSLIRSQKVRIDIHLPPMVSILSTMDTKPIDFYDTSLSKNTADTVKERLQKAEEVLKLRRTKPLKAWESTLDACINLKIKHNTDTIQIGS